MKMYHIALTEQNVGDYAILTGDPGRVAAIASRLSDGHFIAANREYTSYVGFIDGVKVNVMSVGIGGPSMAIGVEELHKLGCRNFIRIGTCGGINLSVKAGDLVIANAAVRQEGTGLEYFPAIYPAVSDFAVTSAIRSAVLQSGFAGDCHVGVVQSKDSFYGEMEPDRMPVRAHLRDLWNIYRRAGVLASEMECATLFLTCAALGARAGALLLAVWNEERRLELNDESQYHETAVLYDIAVEAIRGLMAST